MHSSSSRGILLSLDFPQPRLLQLAFVGISASGSSDSSSGGSGFGVPEGVGREAARLEAIGRVTGTGAGIGAAATIPDASTAEGLGAGAGVSSTVECLPFVQGGIERNSSKVRNRGLQHIQPFHPDTVLASSGPQYFATWSDAQGRGVKGKEGERTFLSLVELWRPRVIYALLIRIRKHLPTSLVNTLLGLRHRLLSVLSPTVKVGNIKTMFVS